VKPSDLDYSDTALDGYVPLAGAKTVEDLVKRIAEATRMEIHADVRYGQLAVHLRTAPGADSARAGDLLKALAYSVTGTIRRLTGDKGSAYVLTDDRVGLGTRHARIADWLRVRSRSLGSAKADAYSAFAAARESLPFPWSNIEGYSPSASLQSVLAKRSRYRRRKDSRREPAVHVKLTELPTEAQEKARHTIEYINSERIKRGSNDSFGRSLRADVVTPYSGYKFAVSVPASAMWYQREHDARRFRTSSHGHSALPEQYRRAPIRLSSAAAPIRAIAVSVGVCRRCRRGGTTRESTRLQPPGLDIPTNTPTETVAAWVSAVKATDATLPVHLLVRPLWTTASRGNRTETASAKRGYSFNAAVRSCWE
jgi:hypothetical protein